MADPVSPEGAEQQKIDALRDARQVINELGNEVILRLHTESDITRGKFNNITNRSALTVNMPFKSFPILFNPTDKQLEKSGIRERTEVLIKLAMLDFWLYGYQLKTLKDIDSLRATVIIEGAEYEIKTKQLDSQYLDTYLYVHLGLNRI